MGKSRLSRLFGKTQTDVENSAVDEQQGSNDVAAETSSVDKTVLNKEQREAFEATIIRLSERMDEMTREFAAMKERLAEIQGLVDKLASDGQDSFAALETNLFATRKGNKSSAKESHTVEEKARTIYLSAPTQDGVFTDFSDRERIGKSIYRLTTEDGRTGQFAVMTTKDATATAVISISQFIKPACKIENTIDSTPSSITTTTCGEAVFNGEAWEISHKAVVRLEK